MQRIFVFILAHFSWNDKNRFLSAPAVHPDGTDDRLLISVLFYADNFSFHIPFFTDPETALPGPSGPGRNFPVCYFLLFCSSAP